VKKKPKIERSLRVTNPRRFGDPEIELSSIQDRIRSLEEANERLASWAHFQLQVETRIADELERIAKVLESCQWFGAARQ
jgi:hypothetical protein